MVDMVGTPLTAREAGLVACTRCMKVQEPARNCIRCAAPLHSREPKSLQRVWAWLAAGLLLYIPANTYPMLRTSTLGSSTESTIIGGAIELVEYGSYGVAAIVLFASVVIPVLKFIAIGYLALTLQKPGKTSAHQKLFLYEIVEFIGRWSMIDVFVVAILSALVQLDFVASINPGPAAACFALSVAFTMLSAQSFDPRLIWDAAGKD
ncbi:MAG: paraquat-inducible protein A, partial [Pseudomonadota bacterium]